ncbi:MAG: enoyl-CoA hydratase/isomerase family protein, partial [Rhodospirillaceae bacterium]|nr:enoyl-CoA hydratase/isomerase family protein [Rhodospirillaceae bacterium]
MARRSASALMRRRVRKLGHPSVPLHPFARDGLRRTQRGLDLPASAGHFIAISLDEHARRNEHPQPQGEHHTMEYRHILFDVSDEIATITLNRPEARNALSLEMRGDLDHALAHVKEQAGHDIKAMIITGAGGAFCAGGDVKAMGNRSTRAPDGHKAMQSSHNRVFNLMNMELPVISLVDGPAAGAGANIALAADFVLMTPRSFIMQAFARIGLVPDWGGFYILPRLVGLQKAKELVYTGRRVYAEEAKEMGMAYDIVNQD